MNTNGGFQELTRPSSSEKKNSGIGVFECVICYDLAQDPIVTLCGHLYCWPCIYKWLHFHSYSHECPVCKSLIKEDNLVPIYGRGSSIRDHPLSRDEIPSRPPSQRPQTAPAPDLTYFRQDVAIERRGNLTRTNLFGAVPSLFNFHGVGLYSSYANGGGYAHGWHHYSIYGRQGAKSLFLKMCFLFLGLLLLISSFAILVFNLV